MRLRRDKTGDAVGRASWRSSLLGDPGAKFLCGKLGIGTKKEKRGKKERKEGLWKLTPLMGIHKERGFPPRLERSLANDARLFHSSHRADDGDQLKTCFRQRFALRRLNFCLENEEHLIQNILVAVACCIRHVPWSRRCNFRKAQQGGPVVKKFHKADRQIATQQEDMSGFMNPLHQGGHTFPVEGVRKGAKIPVILLQGLVSVRVQAGIVAGMRLNAFQRDCAGNRQVMQVRLEFTVTAKSQAPDNTQDRGRIRPQIASNVPNAQQDIVAWAFLDWANQFPSFLAQSGNPLSSDSFLWRVLTLVTHQISRSPYA